MLHEKLLFICIHLTNQPTNQSPGSTALHEPWPPVLFASKSLCLSLSFCILQSPSPVSRLEHRSTVYIAFLFSSKAIWPIPVAPRLLGLRFRILPGALMSVSCECCVLSGKSLCDEPITRTKKSYRLWYVTVI